MRWRTIATTLAFLLTQPARAQLTDDPEGGYAAALARYKSGVQDKIVGGKPAADKELPWQVSLGVSWIADPYEAHFCGGTIYSAQWIVTAGHCVAGLNPEHISVAYGTNRLVNGTLRLNVSEIIRHPDYKVVQMTNYGRKNFRIPVNDVALLKLRTPLSFTDTVQPILLIGTAQEAGFTEATDLVVSGFGAQAEGSKPVPRLFKARVGFIDRATCNSGLSYNKNITPEMMCVGVKEGGVDSCQGDSGGPLVYRGTDNIPQLAGVVSWGDGCARSLKFGVYARIGVYGPWIAQNAK